MTVEHVGVSTGVTNPDEPQPPREPFEDALRDVLSRSDPVPDAVVQSARDAFATAAVNARGRLELASDSSHDLRVAEPDGALVRVLSFGGDLDLQVKVISRGPSHRLSVSTASARPRRATLHSSEATTEFEGHEDGTLGATFVGEGPVHISVEAAEGDCTRCFHTDAFKL
jgi:hypothetical protein